VKEESEGDRLSAKKPLGLGLYKVESLMHPPRGTDVCSHGRENHESPLQIGPRQDQVTRQFICTVAANSLYLQNPEFPRASNDTATPPAPRQI
jgi:hypothetical protein